MSEYTIEYPAATPATIMDDLAEQYRVQVEHHCAVTRYSLYSDANDCEMAEDLHVQTVEWADVADWDVPAEDLPPEDRPAEK